jgi:hypothetical protein
MANAFFVVTNNTGTGGRPPLSQVRPWDIIFIFYLL